MFQPKDEHVCDSCSEMTADYGIDNEDGTTSYTCDRCLKESEAFRDGVRYALDTLKDIFGAEVADTDIWRDYYETYDDE